MKVHESGRSMVEMLGVLTIMGVLSIGAIGGYRYAVYKHQSNVIFNDIKTIAISVLSDNFMKTDESNQASSQDLNIETESKAHYLISKETEETFFITASPIQKGVCEMIIKERPNYIEEIVANPLTTGLCNEQENNEFDFYIDSNLTVGNSDRFDSCDEDHPCQGCAECVLNRCIDKNEKCFNGKMCEKGACICPDGKFLNGGPNSPGNQICSSCSSSTQVYAPESECHKCDNQFYVTSMGGCYGCDNDYYAQLSDRTTSLANCDRCPQRYFDVSTNVCKKCPAGLWKNADGTGCE